jgi:hypothetical protein
MVYKWLPSTTVPGGIGGKKLRMAATLAVTFTTFS